MNHPKKLTEIPRCFGYIMENRGYLLENDRMPVKDCKVCELREKCIEEYNQRVYDWWQFGEQDFQEDEIVEGG